jgi:GH24 family phage-related lysozyme (muramidase)
VQAAQTQFGDDPTILRQTIADAKRDLVKAQIEQIQVNEPAKAKSIADSNRTLLGTEYEPTTERLLARADQQTGTTEGRQAYFDAGQAKGQQMFGAGQQPTDTARSMLRNFEAFKPQAYWDVNHYRVGYGSDTITRPDGTVVPVTQDTVVTQADAERDLQRRTAETTQQVQGQIGPAWNSMTPQAQASLVSVAYNYGQLPQRVATAVQTGDPAKLFQAVLDLGTDNGGVNADRRRFEAEMISGLKGDAYRTILNNPKLNTNQQNYAFEEIRRPDTAAEYATNANATAVKQANDRAANGYVSQMLKGQMPSTDQIANDPNLTRSRICFTPAIEWGRRKRYERRYRPDN